MSSRLLALSVLLAPTAASYVPGCHAHDDAQVPSDVLYEGSASDEGLATFVAAPASVDPARSAALVTPASGATLRGATPARFAWTEPTASFLPSLRRPRPYVAPMPFGPMREAHAHLPAMNGRAYFLTFKSGTNDVLRVFTTDTAYTPSSAAWERLSTAKAFSLTIATASFDNNNIVAGSGPFAGAATPFTLEP